MAEDYAKIGKLMGRQNEYAIYRRFSNLNAQNILYLQAELTHLEKELEQLAKRDLLHSRRIYFSKDWWSLSQCEADDDLEQWEKVLEIRKKLGEYKVARLGVPSPTDLEFLRTWLVRPGMGNYPLLGLDRNSYKTEHEYDLVAVRARAAPDIFSRWLTYDLTHKWHNLIGNKLKDPENQDVGDDIYHYKDSLLGLVIRIVTTVVASLLPVCSVVILYFVNDKIWKLCILVISSGFLALALALTTNARKIEVFAATAAYAAVNVVFLTNTINAS